MTTQLVVDGIEVLVEGEGAQTVVMVHGWPDTHRLWDSTVAHLKAQYRCVRFTLPGYEVAQPARPTSLAQMVDLFKAIVDAVSPQQPITLLVHDWGCIFGYEFAVRHPGRVSRVVGVDIGDHNSGALARSLTAKAKFQVVAYQVWLALAYQLGGSLGDRMSRWMARGMRCKTEPAGIRSQMNYPYAMQWFGTAGGLRGAARFVPHCPMLYIYGARKPFMFHSPRWLQALAATPGCAVQGFRTGHWVMVQQPEAFNQCVGEWLVKTPVLSPMP